MLPQRSSPGAHELPEELEELLLDDELDAVVLDELDAVVLDELDAVVLEELDAVVLDDVLDPVMPDDELDAVIPDDVLDPEWLPLEDDVVLGPVDVELSPLLDEVAEGPPTGVPPAPPTPPDSLRSLPVAQATTVPDANTAATNARWEKERRML